MLVSLKHRAKESELMDDFSKGGSELEQALRELRIINRVFAAARPTLRGVRGLWMELGQPTRLTILDIGAGSGDINRLLLQWASKQQIAMEIILVDLSTEACAEARAYYAGEPRVSVRVGDLFELPDSCADIVTASQFLHHFPTAHLGPIIQKMLRAARMGVVINDIHRHFVAWFTIWTVTRLFSRNQYIRHDAPLSIAKGFRGAELASLQSITGLENLRYYWQPLFRYLAVVRKEPEDEKQ